MLAAAQRLRRSSDFAAAIRGGRRAGRGSVVVHLSPARSTPTTADPDDPTAVEPAPARSIDFPARAGFVVSKAVGPAVVRNTVRRRLRHLMRDRLAGLPAGATVVVRALPAAAATPYAALAADVDAALAAAARAPRSRRDPARRAEPV